MLALPPFPLDAMGIHGSLHLGPVLGEGYALRCSRASLNTVLASLFPILAEGVEQPRLQPTRARVRGEARDPTQA